MPAPHSLNRYLPIAVIIVIALVAFVTEYREVWFQLLDPAGAIEQRQQQALFAVGSSDSALTNTEARDLFDRFSAGESAAGTALVHQDEKHGLPEQFVRYLEGLLIVDGNQNLKAAYLIGRLALNRPFDEQVEAALAGMVRTSSASINAQPIVALGNIGVHRALTDSTLTILLDVALTRSSTEQTALAAIEKTAEPFGLPDWVLDRLEEIAAKRPGQIRNGAIRVIAAAGAEERSIAMVKQPGNAPVDPGTIAKALSGDDLAELRATLEDDTRIIELRAGALNKILKRRDQSERVGQALSYAFTSDESALRLIAFGTYPEWGRHHAKYIDVSWRDVCARAFADENQAIRNGSASAFRFIGFENNRERDRFLLDMLLLRNGGTDVQQLSALHATSTLSSISDPVKQAVIDLVGSSNADIAYAAGMLAERYRPKGLFEGLGSWLAGALLWTLLLTPAVIAAGFETYFIARLLQSIADGASRLVPVLVSVVWFFSSIALGLTLFAGVLGYGHGGASGVEIYATLAVIDVVFFGVGWLLSLAVRQRHPAH